MSQSTNASRAKQRQLRKLLKHLKGLQQATGTLFEQQRAAVDDQAKRIAIQTPRRAGKTYSVIAKAVDLCNLRPNSEVAYIALTMRSARKIALPIVRKIVADLGLDVRIRESTAEVLFANGSCISLYGADRIGWAERMYGQALAMVIIDEAAFFSVSLRDLIGDYVEPCLVDTQGQLILCSIPGHAKRGYFWEIVSGEEAGWSIHKWTTFDNPFMSKQFQEEIDRKREANPAIDKDPAFRRNYYGEWCAEDARKVYSRFAKSGNVIDAVRFAPDETVAYIVGVDFGWDDSTAFSVIAYSDQRPVLYVLESFKAAGMLGDAVAARLKAYAAKYPGLRMVGDPARRQFFEQMKKQYQLPLLEAVKQDKNDWIDLFNTDLGTGAIQIVGASNRDYIKELENLRWTYNERTGKRNETQGLANDICDATLYAFRYSVAYRGRPKPIPVQRGSQEWYRQEEERIIERLENRADDDDIFKVGEDWF